jgi:hypothetical protein
MPCLLQVRAEEDENPADIDPQHYCRMIGCQGWDAYFRDLLLRKEASDVLMRKQDGNIRGRQGMDGASISYPSHIDVMLPKAPARCRKNRYVYGLTLTASF